MRDLDPNPLDKNDLTSTGFWEWLFQEDRSFLNRFTVSFLLALLGFLTIALIYHFSGLYISTITVIISMIIALYGGFLSGVFWVFVLCLMNDYYFIPPVGTVFDTVDALLHLGIVSSVAIGTALLAGKLRKVISQKENAKKVAQQALEARDTLLGIISHELRNPLAAVQTGLELLRMGMAKAAGCEPALKNIDRLTPSIQRMNVLIADLLDVSRLDAHMLNLEPQSCHFKQVVSDTVKSYEPLAEEKLVRLAVDTDPAIDLAFCDPVRSGQILANLIGNAIKFTNTGGMVHIGAKKIGTLIEVEVADNGKGISSEDLPHIFDRFWQGREARHLGVGLGLAIAKGLVEAQGGKIWVQSQPRVGTQITFTVPVPASKAPDK